MIHQQNTRLRGLVAAGFAFTALCASAQTAAPSTDKLSTLSGPTNKAPTMTREELRLCLKQQDETKATSKALGERRSALDAGKVPLTAEADALSAERDALVKRAEMVANEANAKVAAQAAKVQAYNEKIDKLNAAAKQGDNVDRKRQLLDREGVALQKSSDEMNASNNAAQDGLQQAQKALNEKLAAHEAHIADWNKTNKQIEADALSYDDDLASWKRRCGGRNYREIDLKVIREDSK